LLCLAGWLVLAIATAGVLFHPEALDELPAPLAVAAAFALGGAALALLGYWLMRRWGLWLILIVTLARVVSGLAGTLPLQAADLLWPAVVAVVGLVYYRRLR
jgi:hypothetical protein